MGTCVPDSLLSRTGFLTLNQPNIESIRLVTDGKCLWKEDSRHDLALCTFSNLKRLSWIGLSSQGEFDSLADVLDQVSYQLEELEIDLTYHQDWCDHLGYYDSVNERKNAQSIVKMLGLSTPRSSKFPVLKRLALTAIPFPTPESDSHISGSFGFSSLQSLKLRNCDGWEFFFDQFANHAEPLKLRSLEIQCAVTASIHPGHKAAALVDVLQKTHGLEELFLSTTELLGVGIVELWKAVFQHRASLRKFVHHMVDMDIDDENGNFGGYRDLSDLGLSIWQQTGRWEGFQQPLLPALQPVGSLDLTNLGVCCAPDLMVRNARYAASQSIATDILNSEGSYPTSLRVSRCKCCIYGSQARTSIIIHTGPMRTKKVKKAFYLISRDYRRKGCTGWGTRSKPSLNGYSDQPAFARCDY